MFAKAKYVFVLGAVFALFVAHGSLVAASMRSTPIEPLALGAYVGSSPRYVQALDDFRRMTLHDLAIVMWYQAWGDPGGRSFDPRLLDTVVARGAVPLVTWEPWIAHGGPDQPEFALAAIAAGTYDDYIHGWARDAAAWGRPFYLRFAHEMNGSWYPWGADVNGNTPDDYVAAWRHVLGIFREEGATNVRWVWSPNVLLSSAGPSAALNDIAPATSYRSYYPGDDYVDWVALDGYNWGGTGWQSLSEVFARSYDTLVALTEKPVMIAEVGCTEQGGDKAAWIESGLLTEIPQRLPRVRAVIWFNSNQERDWRIDSSPAALQAFRMVAQSARYAGKIA